MKPQIQSMLSSLPISDQDLLKYAVEVGVFLAVIYLVSCAWLAREGIVWKFKQIIQIELVYGIALVFFLNGPPHWAPTQALVAALVCAAIVGLLLPRKRSRYIPAHVKKAVIKRDLKPGQKLSDYDLDHRMPFSRGGSHTKDNLRLLRREQNRRKGKKWPRLKDL